jgi:hypothetical protein
MCRHAKSLADFLELCREKMWMQMQMSMQA